MNKRPLCMHPDVPMQLHQYLGKHIWIKYSVHNADGVLMSLGSTFIILDDGTMIYSPAIQEVTTTPPPKVAKRTPIISNIPLNLGDLF